MTSPVLVLGAGQIALSSEALREGIGPASSAEELLAKRPRAAIVTVGGEAGFFRASLALERGCPKVIVKRSAFERAWLDELAHRADTVGAALFEHDDAAGYTRVTRARGAVRVAIGAATISWASFVARTIVREAAPLPIDTPAPGVPENLEETAFAIGDKPVLYLVPPAHDVDQLLARHPGATAVVRDETVSVDAATGTRRYGPGGEARAHVFLSGDRDRAERAAKLWDAGSSTNLVELGALLGYPDCCTAAFAMLADRGDNAALVYTTAARSLALGGVFPAPLNVVVRRLVPFTPCTFGCGAALRLAERVLGALESNVGARLLASLSRPVLYLDEARSVVFDGARRDGDLLTYEDARRVHAGPIDAVPVSSAWFPRGGTVRLSEDGLEVGPTDARTHVARRTTGLGVFLPFGW